MKMNRKIMYLISGMYLVCMTQVILHTNLILLLWRRRKNKRSSFHLRLMKDKLLVDEILSNRIRRRKRRQNKIRSYDFWVRIVQNEFEEDDWFENFRVSQNTFNFIVDELREELTPKENILNDGRVISDVKKKVAVALYYLASSSEYRVIGNTFGIHKATVHNIVHEFVEAVNKILLPQFIQMPNEATAIENSSFFKNSTKLPNVIGAIDGSHIPIQPPTDGHRDFINRKGWASIILQGVVDHRYRFMDICVKNPGATHDAAVLAGSDLYKNMDKIMPKSAILLQDKLVPYIILGDPAYPLLPWLMKPYSSRGLTAEQDSYNVYTSSGRVAVEIAFGRLKARWRRLLKKCDVNYTFVPSIVATCCTLHNIIETRKDKFSTKWTEEIEKAELVFPQPKHRISKYNDSITGDNLRNYLCDYLKNNFPLRVSRQVVN